MLEPKTSPWRQWPLALGLIAIVLWCAYFALALSTGAPSWLPKALLLPLEKDGISVLEARGQFGDSFGAFNALVSTLALIGLFYTIRAQQKQILDQDQVSKSNHLLVRQQQFQDKYYFAIESYRSLLHEVQAVDMNSKERMTGRAALQIIWRDHFIKNIARGSNELFDQALTRQREDYEIEQLGEWSGRVAAADALSDFLSTERISEESVVQILTCVGRAWAGAYFTNRYQLDALFRAWYTVYRVLGTSTTYEITNDEKRLYSAVFRSQLSWIELAMLLINQYGLPSNRKFPRACIYSNNFEIFDNLDLESDAVVALLSALARARDDPGPEGSEVLVRLAFGKAGEGMASSATTKVGDAG